MTVDSYPALPVLLDLRDRRALVLGGGAACVDAVDRLRAAGAQVTVITGTAGGPELAATRDGGLAVESRGYVRGDLAGADLALCFSADDEAAAGFAAEARAVGCLVYVDGEPTLSTFALQPGRSDKGES